MGFLKWLLGQPQTIDTNWSTKSQTIGPLTGSNYNPQSFGYPDDLVQIQMSVGLSGWSTVEVVKNQPAYIESALNSLSSQFPGKNLRAVTSSGQLLSSR